MKPTGSLIAFDESGFLKRYREQLENLCRHHMNEADAYDDEGAHVGFATRKRSLAAGINEAIHMLDEMWRTRNV